MYMHIVHQLSLPKIERMFVDLFGLKISHTRLYRAKEVMANYYSATVKRIIRSLLQEA